MDKKIASKVSAELEVVLKKFAEDHSMDVDTIGGSYSSMGGTFTPKVIFKEKKIGGIDRDIALFNEQCDMYDLKPEDYGRPLTSHTGEIYKLVGFMPSRPKFCLVGKNNNGKRMLFIRSMISSSAVKVNTYSYTAWVHPKAGGDDYQIEGKVFAPDENRAKAEIKKILAKKSAVTDDFQITGGK
jgi:hypothetical protein